MEVLISAGVTAVGLFGVIAIVPLAAVQVGKGVREDRKAVMGKNGLGEVRARGMLRPENWRTYGQNRTSGMKFPLAFAPQSALVRIFSGNAPNFVPLETYPALVAVCIDPRFVEANKNDPRFYSFPLEAPTENHPSRFPYPPTANSELLIPSPLGPRPPLSMPRISLAASPGGLPMNALLADEIFVSQDDLEFVIPDGDRTQPPVQLLSSTNAKRQSLGYYSWLATLVPKHGMISDEYVLSIVVFYKRDPAMTINDVATATSASEVNERVVSVAAFAGQGVGGGEVTLQAASAAELDAIPQNSWIMLAGNTWLPGNMTGLPDFKWCRVIGIDDVTGTGPYTRAVTLQGADWERPEWHRPIADPNYRPTQATIMANVIGVYEKTIRLETTSLWSQ